MDLVSGKVSFFNDIVGTGYIRPDQGPGIIKFTYKNISRSGYRLLCEGQRVMFELQSSPHGPVAENIIPLEIYTDR